jgi:hypothetical protein
MSRNFRRLITCEIPPLRFVGKPVGKTPRGAEIFSGLLKFGRRITTGKVYLVRRPSGIGYLRLFAVLDGSRADSPRSGSFRSHESARVPTGCLSPA